MKKHPHKSGQKPPKKSRSQQSAEMSELKIACDSALNREEMTDRLKREAAEYYEADNLIQSESSEI